MRSKIIALLVLLIASNVYGQDFPGANDTVSPIVRSWHFTTLNEAPMNSAGTALSVACAAPPAINMGIGYGQPFLLVPSANTTLVGSWGIYGAGAISNLVQRRSFESWDDANTPTGWVDVIAAGDGSAVISEENTIVAHGGSSVKMVLTGTTSSALVSTGCITCTASTCDYDMYLSAWGKKTSGTSASTVMLVEYDTDACGTYLQNQKVLAAGNMSSDWVKYGGVLTAASFHVNTSSFLVRLLEEGDGGVTTYFDAVQLREASTPTDAYCLADTDAVATCNLIDVTDTNPPINMQSHWQAEATIRSPIDGAVATPVRHIIAVPGTAGNNNRISMSWASDVLTCTVYDSAGAAKTSTVAATGNANTDYVVKMSKSASGVIQCCFDGTCDATPATGALTDGIGAELIFGGTGAAGGEVWVQDPVIRRRLTE